MHDPKDFFSALNPVNFFLSTARPIAMRPLDSVPKGAGRARLPTSPRSPFATSGQQGRHSSASAERRRPPEPWEEDTVSTSGRHAPPVRN